MLSLRTRIGLASSILAGCFSPNVTPAGTETEGETGSPPPTSSPDTQTSGNPTGDPTSGTPGTSTAPTSDSSSTGSDAGPEILEFTVDGASSAEVNESRAVALHVNAVDPNGEVVRADFYIDDVLVATVDGPLMEFDAEYIVSGAADNGLRAVYAVVEDNDGNQAQSDTLDLLADVTNGGLLDVWEDIGGFTYGVAVDANGENVVASGIEQPVLGDPSFGQVQRLVGGAWSSTDQEQTPDIADVVSDGGDGFWGAGSTPTTDGGRDTYLMRFDAGGQLADAFEVDAATGQSVGQDGVDYARSISRFSNGDLLVVGLYVPADGSPTTGSYATRLTAAGEVAWLEQVTESGAFSGTEIFVYDGAVSQNDEVILVGSARVGGVNQVWYALLDEDGGVTDEQTLGGEYYESIGYAASVDTTGGFVLTGTHRASDTAEWRRWLRKYGPEGGEEWTREGAADASFTQAVVHDFRDNIIAASAESCEFNGITISYWHCSIAIRKYDAEGELIWEEDIESGASEFNGPLLFAAGIKMDLEVDRFGYAYLSALHRIETPARGDWWVAHYAP